MIVSCVGSGRTFGQSKQSASLVPPDWNACPLNTTRTVWRLYVPAWHGVSAADSRGQKVPALHSMGLEVAFGQKKPAARGVRAEVRMKMRVRRRVKARGEGEGKE